jgi:GNAT superfamily N-acetyltransferase
MLISHLTVIEIVDMDRIITDPTLELECRRLSHGGSSGMNKALDHYHDVKRTDTRPIDAKGIFAKYMRQYIGWALWTRETDNYSFNPAPGRVAFQIYVNHEYRRKGIGTKLFNAAQTLVQPHEQLHVYYVSNPAFFRPFVEEGLCKDVY